MKDNNKRIKELLDKYNSISLTEKEIEELALLTQHEKLLIDVEDYNDFHDEVDDFLINGI